MQYNLCDDDGDGFGPHIVNNKNNNSGPEAQKEYEHDGVQ